MELVKELPEIFSEFGEQRRKSFMDAYALKQQGIPFVGAFCTYLPQEIPLAMGAAVVGLCSKTGETIPEAEMVLPRNLCPLIKASYGFAKTDKCPYFYFSDLIIGETTCDGKKKMYELLGQIKPVHVMELPNSQSPAALLLWKSEILRLKEKLESHFGVTITEDAIREAIKLKNRERQAIKAFYALQKQVPAPMDGMSLHQVLEGVQFKFDREKAIDELWALIDKIQRESDREKYRGRKRILVTGSPIGGVAAKTIQAIEEAGGQVVAMENCGGAKSVDELVDEENPDVYDALARRYLNIGCSCMTPNPNRFKMLGELFEEYRVDAVVEIVLQACHTFAVEAYSVKKFATKRGIPYLGVETDYSTSDEGQLRTRMAAFMEML